ncbi:large conductance mechanosensitive channel protein MscL [Salsipaludibacter albus]|uniref:large conductance mechanosensitive channel protein MscL n=1 Tax=Salsipaludibacter albus TaxID=2849650 RepID=UPI001EE3E38B|nr:large conductance mechanosensitive channel protein MscL [Salsipaludibacter albus]MBY5162812.1 large conductance mechanosensitive channel protein MscL [Salsipaludibacter albus]
MIQEFKDFINRGNVIDLAVAVVLGAAFTPVITAIVDRVLMPLIGLIFGQPNFDAVGTFACAAPTEGAEGIVNAAGELCAGSVGAVITTVINFVLVALALFFVVKAYNRMKGPEEVVEEEARTEEATILAEIRDELRARPNA